jgi:hypothetical protein
MLCAFSTVLTTDGTLNEMLDSINWDESGLTRDIFESWWTHHQAEDEKRRAREAEEHNRRMTKYQNELDRHAYIKSMSVADRKLLGIELPRKPRRPRGI